MTEFILRRLQINYSIGNYSDINFYGIGSILQNIKSSYDGFIWSSGFIYPEHKLSCSKIPLAIRGKLSIDYIDCTDKDTIPLGDGGLLLDRIYPNNYIPYYDIGILPHYSDVIYPTEDPIQYWDICKQSNVLFIHPCRSPEVVIPQILQCKKIMTSSLHGIVTCDAYDIDHCIVKLKESNIGLHTEQQSFKFRDYYSIYNKTFNDCYMVNQNISIGDIDILCNENKRYYKHEIPKLKDNLLLSLLCNKN